MSKFNNLYVQALINHLQLNWTKNLIILDKTLSNKLPYIFNNVQNIFQQAEYIKKFNYIWKDLIYEYPSNYANYGSSILNIIFNGKNKQIYSKQQFLQMIPKTWKYYKDLINLKNFNIYIYKFDFSNSQQENQQFSLIDELLNFYNEDDFKFTKNKIITKLDRYIHAQAFKNMTHNSTGCVRPKILVDTNTDGILMFLNTSNYQLNTINHELFHVFQELLGIDLFQQSQTLLPALTKEEKQQIKNIGLSDTLLSYYFSIHDFWANIHNNLIDELEKIFKTSKLSRTQFIQKIFKDAQNFQVYQQNNLLAFLKTIFFLKTRLKCFSQVINILINHFK